MNPRGLVRAGLIAMAGKLRVDELALRWQQWQAGRGRAPRMLVVETHETPTRNQAEYRRQLEWVARHFRPVDLPTFMQLWEEYRHAPPKDEKPPVLFTFDDGRLSNYLVAAPVLESLGARGVFFIIPSWVLCSPEKFREFYYSRIDFQPPPGDHTPEDWSPLTPEQIADLARRGHTVGNHTFSHVRLAGLSGSELQHEVVESAQQLAGWSGKPVDAFAWAFSWDSISREAWKLIREHHRYCFAPCPGSVDCRSDSEQLIWRTEIECRYSPAEYRFMYSGLADGSWRSRREKLKAILWNETGP